MNSKEEARHSSALETKQYVTSKSSVWTGNTTFTEDNDTYKDYLDLIDVNKTKHLAILIGYTTDKNNKEQLLIKDLLFIMPAIRTWASRPAINKPEIKGLATMAESKIKSLEDTILLSTAKGMKDILDNNPTIIDPLYVPLARQTSFYQNILNFESVIQMPEQMIDERAAATKAMYDNLNLAIKFRKETFLDTAKHYRETDPDFYNGFVQSMKIDNNPSHKLSVKGNIKEDGTDNPVANVRCYIPALEKTAKSGAKGNFLFKSLPAGEYTIIFTKFGYEPVTKTIVVNDNERTEISIKLVLKVFPE